MKKKIGILTLHRANNYGAVLQNFALQTAINNAAFLYVETIDYRNNFVENQYKLFPVYHSCNLLKVLFFYGKRLLNIGFLFRKNHKFNHFRRKYLKLSKGFKISNISSCSYDVVIVGSDQVWNSDIVGKKSICVYNLSFFNGKKASYAASSGNTKMMFSDLHSIEKIDIVTVREDELNTYLKAKEIESVIVCDPVFLLSKDEWIQCFQLQDKISDYVYLYYIDSGKDEAAKIAQNIAKRQNCNVLISTKNRSFKKMGFKSNADGPIDFLNRIINAKFVVVSSFHGVAFAIIFKKQFIALLHEETGGRVVSLLKKLGLENRIVANYKDYLNRDFNEIDFSSVEKEIIQWRNNSLMALDNICKL